MLLPTVAMNGEVDKLPYLLNSERFQLEKYSLIELYANYL